MRRSRDADFYRVDQFLERSISQDDIGRVGELVEAGEALRRAVEWEPILAGSASPFKVEMEPDGILVKAPPPAGSPADSAS